MKVDTSRVAVAVEQIMVMFLVFLGVVVVVQVQIMMGICLEVVRNTLWYTRVAVAVVVEHRIEINTRGIVVTLMVVFWATADAVVRG